MVVADRGLGRVKIRALADEVDKATDIHRGALHRSGRAFTMLTDSTELKSTGRPLPLLVMRARTAVDEKVGRLARMLALAGAPKFVVVNALEVSFEKSRTSVMEISVNC